MIHKANLMEISDGHIYSCNDLCRVGCNDCRGCHACCTDMGNSVTLDAYDAMRLCLGIKRPFFTLLSEKQIDICVNEGVYTPFIKMDANNRCPFLNEEGRCKVHAFRPGVCRLFPLGRVFDEKGISYLLQKDACMQAKTKVRIEKWLGQKDIRKYEAFTYDWHQLTMAFKNRVLSTKNTDLMSEYNTVFLQVFYGKAYEEACFDDFSMFLEEYTKRKELLKKVLG